MWKPSNPIEANASSMLELKSELLKKRQEIQESGGTSQRAVKKRSLKLKQNPNVDSRSAKDLDDGNGGGSHGKREQILAKKARLYDQLVDGKHLDDIPTDEIMVDFERKFYEKRKQEAADTAEDDEEEEKIEVEDEYGRLRLVPKSSARGILGLAVNLEDDVKEYHESEKRGYHMYPPVALPYYAPHVQTSTRSEILEREREAKDDWQDLLARAAKSEVERYDSTKERRTLGTAFYKFSHDETERQEEMQRLKDLSKETEDLRAKEGQTKMLRKTRIQERMELIKKRQAEVTGVSTEPGSKKPPAVKSEDVSQFLDSVLQ